MSTLVDERVVEMRFDNRDFEKNTKKSLLLKKAMIGMIAASTTLTGCSFDEDFDNSEQVEEVTEPEYGYAAVAYENDKAIIREKQ